MTKKQLVKELKKNGATESESALMKKSIDFLEEMLEEIKKEESVEIQPIVQVDIESMKAEMMAQLKAEMEAKVREELLAEMKAKEESTSPVGETFSLKKPRKVTEIDRNMQVPIMNITPFSLVYMSPRTGAEWNWDSYGDIEYMEVSEILTMRSGQRRFLDFPFVLIMDDEVVNYLGLEKQYAKIESLINPAEIDKVFKLKMDKFKEVIDNAPQGVQVLIVGRAKHLIQKGEFDSMHKVNYINSKFNTDLVIESV